MVDIQAEGNAQSLCNLLNVTAHSRLAPQAEEEKEEEGEETSTDSENVVEECMTLVRSRRRRKQDKNKTPDALMKEEDKSEMGKRGVEDGTQNAKPAKFIATDPEGAAAPAKAVAAQAGEESAGGVQAAAGSGTGTNQTKLN